MWKEAVVFKLEVILGICSEGKREKMKNCDRPEQKYELGTTRIGSRMTHH